MTECAGCQQCESGPVVTLRTGAVVCSSCPEWRLECEARELNAMPLDARREQWKLIRAKRGQAAADELYGVMKELEQ